MKTGCGNLYVTINEDEKGICEIFSTMGKTGGCAASQTEATSRLVSLSMRSGVDIKEVVKELRGIRCPAPAWDSGEMILSCSDAIARAIEDHLRGDKSGDEKVIEQTRLNLSEERSDGEKASGEVDLGQEKPTPTDGAEVLTELNASTNDNAGADRFLANCPDCGSTVEHESGCVVCRSCGYSKCG